MALNRLRPPGRNALVSAEIAVDANQYGTHPVLCYPQDAETGPGGAGAPLLGNVMLAETVLAVDGESQRRIQWEISKLPQLDSKPFVLSGVHSLEASQDQDWFGSPAATGTFHFEFFVDTIQLDAEGLEAAAQDRIKEHLFDHGPRTFYIGKDAAGNHLQGELTKLLFDPSSPCPACPK
jgi:hypothetical protein